MEYPEIFEKFEGEYECIHYDNTEPLIEEHKHFYDCIINNRNPLTDGYEAIEVLQILERAQERLSIKQNPVMNY